MAAITYQIFIRLLLLRYITLLLIISCPNARSISEAEALLKFKMSLSNSESLNSWDPNTTPCEDKTKQWNGIICYEGIVIGLHVQSMGLSGTIDVKALSNLRGLRTISLENNNFSGPMPELNLLGALKAIYLTNNQFSGSITGDFFSKTESLKKLWLANNSFSGEIPSSLAQLRHLVELHLENNEFSGVVPPLKQPPLVSLDLSNNQLQGEIPMSLANFKPESFKGNPNLCGAIVIGKDCTAVSKNQSSPGNTKSITQSLSSDDHHAHKRQFYNFLALGMSVTLVLLSLVVVAVFVANKNKKPQQQQDENNNNNNNISNAGNKKGNVTSNTNNANSNNSNERLVEVDIVGPIMQKDSSQSSTHSASSKGKGSNKGSRGGIGDLTMVNEEKGVFGLADLMKASAEVLGNGGIGSAYKAVMANGLAVVVKRMRELNNLEKDAFDMGIKKLANLKHNNILTPLAFHYRKEEKLVVYEFVAKGSLHYLLHGDRGASHEELNWPIRLNIIKGITEGLSYLHSQLQTYDLPHGNLKSSNILINSQNEPLLSDYGFSPMVTPTVAAQALFGSRAPEAIQNQTLSAKCDVYCLGVVILEILTCKFPSQYLSTTKGGTDVVQWVTSAIEEGKEAKLVDPDIVSKSDSGVENMVEMLRIGVACTKPNPNRRPSLSEIKERIERVDVQDSMVV